MLRIRKLVPFVIAALLASAGVYAQSQVVTAHTAFFPQNLPGMKAWHQSDIGVTISTRVSNWDNMVPAEPFGDLIQGTTADEPALTASVFPSGKPGIEGDGTSRDLAFNEAKVVTGDLTMIVVLEWDSSVQGIFWLASDVDNRYGCSAGTQDDFFVRVAASNLLLSDGDDCDATGILNSQHSFILYRDSAGNWTIYMDGTDITAAGTPNLSGAVNFLFILQNSTGTFYDSVYGIVGISDTNYKATYHTQIQAYVDNWSGL